MKKMDLFNSPPISGGDRCVTVAGVLSGFGSGLIASVIPINVIVGVISVSAGALVAYNCK
ncbi:MAG: hypothetical protein KA210_09355 [Bacteroidia bacterium]|jgi:hypothetical protein|nr:hypothetical protein [Bacteroidia bacterium]